MTKWRIAHNVIFILFLFVAPGILIGFGRLYERSRTSRRTR